MTTGHVSVRNGTVQPIEPTKRSYDAGITSLSDIEQWLQAARPRLYHLAQVRGIAPDAIEDVVQETLLEAWKHLDRLHTPSGLFLWLDEICRNICRRYWREQVMEQQHSAYQHNEYLPETTTDLMLDHIADDTIVDPLGALDQQDMALLVDHALGSMAQNTRELVEMCYLLELPQREVATRLGISISALEARLHRARRQLRQLLNGTLRGEAEALGLSVSQEGADGWQETRIWCTLCGRRRLLGLFLPQSCDGGVNLHMRCPDCERQYGLSDVHSSNVHSKGLVQLDGLMTFRPAWKRTMQGLMAKLTQVLRSGEHLCPYCGTPADFQLVDKIQAEAITEQMALATHVSRHPYQFWVEWHCPRCHIGPNANMGLFAASDLVYWSQAESQQFMRTHPRWRGEPELLVEYSGQPAIRFQMAGMTGASRLTILAHRQTLEVLAVYP